MARALSSLIRYFSNYFTLHRSDLAARAAPLDPRFTQAAEYLSFFNRISDLPDEQTIMDTI